MKLLRSFCLLITMLCCLVSVNAQNEQDFASRYMSLYAKTYSLECTTVSPLMFEKMMNLSDVKNDAQIKEVFSQLKSIQVVDNAKQEETSYLYNKALQLVQHNEARYKQYAQRQSKRLFVRRKGKIIVEMVLFMKYDHHFKLINLTGNMTDDFLKHLMNT